MNWNLLNWPISYWSIFWVAFGSVGTTLVVLVAVIQGHREVERYRDERKNNQKRKEEEKQIYIQKQEVAEKLIRRQARPFFMISPDNKNLQMITQSGMPVVNVKIISRLKAEDSEIKIIRNIPAFSSGSSIEVNENLVKSDWTLLKSETNFGEKVYWVYLPEVMNSYNFVEKNGEILNYKDEVEFSYPYNVLKTHISKFDEDFDFKVEFLNAARKHLEANETNLAIADLTNIIRERQFSKQQAIDVLSKIGFWFATNGVYVKEWEYERAKHYFLGNLGLDSRLTFDTKWYEKVENDSFRRPYNLTNYTKELIELYKSPEITNIDYYVRNIEVYARDCVEDRNKKYTKVILEEIMKIVI